jgi:hypothetical protein
MKLKIVTACLLAAVALAQAPHALATEVGTVSYFGVVDNTETIYGRTEPAPDYDVAGLFGSTTVPTNLEGDFITATFNYTSALGVETSTPGASDELDGGALVSASVSIQDPTTLNIYTYTFTPDYASDAYTSMAGLSEDGYSTAGDQIYSYILSDAAGPTSLAQSFSSTGFGGGSYFLPAATNTGQLDAIVFDTLYVTVSATPEPGSWALMVLGVGAIGLGLRFSRSRRLSGAGLPA